MWLLFTFLCLNIQKLSWPEFRLTENSTVEGPGADRHRERSSAARAVRDPLQIDTERAVVSCPCSEMEELHYWVQLTPGVLRKRGSGNLNLLTWKKEDA